MRMTKSIQAVGRRLLATGNSGRRTCCVPLPLRRLYRRRTCVQESSRRLLNLVFLLVNVPKVRRREEEGKIEAYWKSDSTMNQLALVMTITTLLVCAAASINRSPCHAGPPDQSNCVQLDSVCVSRHYRSHLVANHSTVLAAHVLVLSFLFNFFPFPYLLISSFFLISNELRRSESFGIH